MNHKVALLFSLMALASGAPRNTETFEGEIVEEHDDYMVIRYPASKWVCTSRVEDVTKDKHKDWQSRFPNGLMAMTSTWNDPDKEESMFKKVYKYIVGVNSEAAEIKMTRPVTTLRMPVKEDPTMQWQEMCFWTGSPWEDKTLPEPLNENVTLQNREEMEVFVRKFSGYAISHDDWNNHKEALMQSLDGRNDVDTKHGFYTVGYDSPFKLENRRNEVWIPKLKTPTEPQEGQLGQEAQTDEKEEKKYYGKYEAVPYKVIEKTDVYELREYPGSNWVCTTMQVDPTKDPMNGWEEKYDNNPFAAMADTDWREGSISKMFMMLFKYISGVNMEGKEIKMTIPVTGAHIPKEDGTETQTMCFWLGSAYDNQKPPRPLDKAVFIQKREPLRVYVKQFGGFMLSFDDGYKVYQEFVQAMADKATKDRIWYSLSYDSPWETKDRRNEIWLEEAV